MGSVLMKLFSGTQQNSSEQRSSGQALRHHLAVHDGDVDEEQQDDEEVIHEAQQPHHALWDEVQRRGQVGQSAQHTQQDPDAEHPEETSHGEHLSEGVPQQRRDVPQTVQQLQRHTNTVPGGNKEHLNIHTAVNHHQSVWSDMKTLRQTKPRRTGASRTSARTKPALNTKMLIIFDYYTRA